MLDRETLKLQLDKFVQDSAAIRASMAQIQKDIEECQSKLKDLSQNLERHQGALNYSSIVLDFTKKQLLEIEKTETPAGKDEKHSAST